MPTKGAGRAVIAFGSNLGDSLEILNASVRALQNAGTIDIVARSHWYRTKAVGPPQPDYINGCALLQTSHSPQDLLQTLLSIEQQFGRVRKERWAPRTLDLDLLLFNDLVLQTPTLQIPHPRMTERAFVLVPLAEIAPNWIEPISQHAIVTLLEAVNCSDVHKLDPDSPPNQR
jgi:2-amino-4-hydroxy-6-hydroxymethyldihydropteridine diphosphokinase